MIEIVNWIHLAQNTDPRRASKFLDQLSNEKLLKRFIKEIGSGRKAFDFYTRGAQLQSWPDSNYPD
jgi:hypothetical protein